MSVAVSPPIREYAKSGPSDIMLSSVPTGMLATLAIGMSLRDSALVILFFSMITCIPPAFMSIGGANTGLRQLVQARYSFGYECGTLLLRIQCI